VLANGRRWGKTLLGGKEIEPNAFVKNRFDEPQKGWIVGPEYADAEKEFRIIYDDFRRLGVEEMCSKFTNNPDSGNMHIKTSWGFELECRSAKHPETLVGEGLDFVLFVEAGRLTRSTWRHVRPTLSDKRGWTLFTGVPEEATDISLLYSFWDRGQDQERKTWKSWRMPSWTNLITFPGGRQDEEILEAEEDLTEDEFRRQYGAEFVERAGRVMKEWDDEVHLTNLDYDRAMPLYGAVDYGYREPFVWLWIQIDPWNTVYVLEEHYVQMEDVADIAAKYIQPHNLFPNLLRFYDDPSRPDDRALLMRLLRKEGWGNTGGERNTRDMLIRDALKRRPAHAPISLQKPGLYVDRRRCPNLAWEMREGYRWPVRKEDAVKSESEKPMDKDNHGVEALGRFFKGHLGQITETRTEGTRVSRARIRR
jgi:hypothetical protein